MRNETIGYFIMFSTKFIVFFRLFFLNNKKFGEKIVIKIRYEKNSQ